MSKQKNQIFFLRRLAFLLSSGHSIHESLCLLLDSYKDKDETVLHSLVQNVASGGSFASALSSTKSVTDRFVLKLILIGEKTGTLASMVLEGALQLERKRLFLQKILGSLLYPVCVLGGVVIVGLSLVFFVFPKVLPVFASLGVPLPWSTQFLIGSVFLIVKYWWLLCILIFLVFYAVWRFAFPYAWRVPLVNQIWLGEFFKMQGLMLAKGVPLSESVLFSAELSFLPVYEKILLAFYEGIKEGRELSGLCRDAGHIFPALAYGLIASLEKSGNLSEGFLYMADFYAQEVESHLRKMTELIEPILMIVLGLGVGFLGIALLGPIYGITQHVYK